MARTLFLEGGRLLFKHSNYFHANISRTKRGVTLKLIHNRHVITPLSTRGDFPGKPPFSNRYYLPNSETIEIAKWALKFVARTLFLEVDLYGFNIQMTSSLILAEQKEVWLWYSHNRHVITPLLTRGEFPNKSPFTQRYFLLNIETMEIAKWDLQNVARSLVLEVPLYCFNIQMKSTRILAERKEVWLWHIYNGYRITLLPTSEECPGKLPFLQRY